MEGARLGRQVISATRRNFRTLDLRIASSIRARTPRGGIDRNDANANHHQNERRGFHPSYLAITSEALCPPKPNELLMAVRILASLATCGT